MAKQELKVGDMVTVRGETYGSFMLHKFLPVGAHGRSCRLVEVLHSTLVTQDVEQKFASAVVRTFRLVDVRKAQQSTNGGGNG
jgi:hypothetical protein